MAKFNPKTYYNDLCGPGLYAEHLPPCPTIHKFLPANVNIGWTTANDITNGCWVILKECCPRNLVKRIENHKTKGYTMLGMPDEGYDNRAWDIAHSEPQSDATLLFVIMRSEYSQTGQVIGMGPRSHIAIFRNETGQAVAYNGEWIAYFQKHIPQFSLSFGSPHSPAIMHSGETEAGLIMPIILDDELQDYLLNQKEAKP